jgi:hypothetical protein
MPPLQIKRIEDLVFLSSEFYLFSYGANGCRNLAKRLFGDPNKEDHPEMIAHISQYTSPGRVNHFQRIFFGYSSYWEGGVAALRKSFYSHVEGLFIHIHHDGKRNFRIGDQAIHLEHLARVESLNRGMYCLQQLSPGSWNLRGVQKSIPAYAFFGCPESEPHHYPPSRKYLDAVGRMLAECQSLHNKNSPPPMRAKSVPSSVDKSLSTSEYPSDGCQVNHHRLPKDIPIRIILEPQQVAKNLYVYHPHLDRGHFSLRESEFV